MNNLYRKRPLVIEAWQWDESEQTLNEIGCGYMSYDGHQDTPDLVRNLRIATLEGTMNVNKGDWIIKGIKGEFYPIELDIFEKTYEKVDD